MTRKDGQPDYRDGDSNRMKPVYDSLCISRMLQNLGSILEGKTSAVPGILGNCAGNSHMVLLIADGMGLLNIKENIGRLPFLDRLNTEGSLAAGTSVFPSTTAASMTSLYTASDPFSHGLLEWYLYLDEAEMVIETLPFSAQNPAEADKFKSLDLDIRLLFEGEPYTSRLTAEGIECTAIMPRSIKDSAYSSAVFPSADTIGYETLEDVLPLMMDKGVTGKRLTVIYYPGADTEGHVHGPLSENYLEEMRRVDSFLRAFRESGIRETSLVMTADHGQTEIDPRSVVYLDEFDWFDDMLPVAASGKTIPPYGSPRDVIIRSMDAVKMKSMLERELGDTAAAAESFRLAGEGYFGSGKKARSLSSRMGDLWLLPGTGTGIWYRHFDDEEVRLKGMHGGLTAKEMLIPVAVV